MKVAEALMILDAKSQTFADTRVARSRAGSGMIRNIVGSVVGLIE